MRKLKISSKGVWAVATAATLGLYIVALVVTWFRKNEIDYDLLFWLGMAAILFSAFTFPTKKDL